MKHFGKIKDAITYLDKEGYLIEFFIKREGLWNSFTGMFHSFKDVEIVEIVELNDDENGLKYIYAIQVEGKTKGIFIE